MGRTIAKGEEKVTHLQAKDANHCTREFRGRRLVYFFLPPCNAGIYRVESWNSHVTKVSIRAVLQSRYN